MSIDVNVTNDLVIVTESSEDITVNVSNAAGPAGVGVPVGGSTGQVLKKLSNTNYDTYWALDGGGVPYSGATGDVDLGEYELKAGQVEFDQTPTGTTGVGVMRWNDSDGTVDLGLKGGNVTLQVGQEQVLRVVNKTGADLLESQYRAVRIRLAAEGGSQGQRLAVVLAQGNNDANSTDTIGIVTETITNNLEGFICTSGIIRGINTTGSLQGETWADGDIIYLSPTIAGAITTVKPTAPNHSVILGYVIYAHNVNGKIFVKCETGYEIGELHDCYVPTPSNNDGIFWNTANLRYQNNTIAGALGYTPVPSTRTLTINGTAYDLSADRSWTVSTGGTTIYSGDGTISGNRTVNISAGNYLFFNGGTVKFGSATGPANWDTLVDRIQVGSGAIYGYQNESGILANTYYNGGWKYISNDFAGFYNLKSGQHIWYTAPSGTAGNSISYTNRMVLTQTGRLLLGTTDEGTYLLDVNGTARIKGALQITGDNGQVQNSIFQSSVNGLMFWGSGSTADFMFFDASGIPRLRLLSSNLWQYDAPIRLGVTGLTLGASSGGPYINYQASEGIILFGQTGGTFSDVSMWERTGTFTACLKSTGSFFIGAASISHSPSAQLDVVSTTKGFLPPRMTNAQRTAISSPAVGLIVYCTDATEGLYEYTSAGWVNLNGVVTNRQTASYTLALTDVNDLVEMNVATANNLTVPLNSSIAFPIGTKIDIAQYGAGQTTVVATSGVTIRSAGGALKLAAQYSGGSLVKIATDEWYLFGDITV